ncbi:MAG: hypothetical protein K1X28_02670 [Parachlamydiales bacterium]|nr:hypothetical protein [Parachlamydiales bacterium]
MKNMVDYKPRIAWRLSGLRDSDGVLVGTDITQEWLLPWWWSNYQKHNSMPVAFIDFGMSSEKKDWCKARGELIPLRLINDFVKEKKDTLPKAAQILEQHFGKDFWDSRPILFKKPFACLKTPFLRTIWVDIDCEVRGSIQPLFAYADGEIGIGLVKDRLQPHTSYPIYNSGVFVFRRKSWAISQWARACVESNDLFPTDDHVLAHLIANKKVAVSEMPSQYNWFYSYKEPASPVVIHWLGKSGKNLLRIQIANSNLQENFS